jgi:hypothetical protein
MLRIDKDRIKLNSSSTIILVDVKDKKKEQQEQELELWTIAKLQDEFFLCLSKYPNENLFYSDRKYYALAKELLYKIPIYRPSPTFIFNISDLSARCKEEFIEFVKLNSKKDINQFLKDIAVKFFEGVKYHYTHISVIRKLKVGYDD